MKTKGERLVNKAEQIILDAAKAGDSKKDAKKRISVMLAYAKGFKRKIENEEYFDRNYFKKYCRMSIAQYYDKVIGCPRNFSVCFRHELEECDCRMISIKAASKEDAVRTFLKLKYKYEDKYLLKETLFEKFFISCAYGECFYVEKFQNAEEILVMVNEIYNCFFVDEEKEPDELYDKLDTTELAERYWTLLNDEDKKETYYHYFAEKVICKETITKSKYESEWRTRVTNIIEDLEKEDVIIFNTLVKLIKEEKKEYYTITQKLLEEHGYSDEAKMLINYCCSYRLKYIYRLSYSDSNFKMGHLYDWGKSRCVQEDDIEVYKIYPSLELYELADAGYDFKDGLNDVATKVLYFR